MRVSFKGLMYLAVGFILWGYSSFVISKTRSTSLNIFIYLGIAMMILGVFHIVKKFINSDDKNERSLVKNSRDGDQSGNNSGKRTVNSSKKSFIICPKCGARLHPASRYCNWCGYKLK